MSRSSSKIGWAKADEKGPESLGQRFFVSRRERDLEIAVCEAQLEVSSWTYRSKSHDLIVIAMRDSNRKSQIISDPRQGVAIYLRKPPMFDFHTGKRRCDLNGDSNRASSNHNSCDSELRSEPHLAAVWANACDFGLCDLNL